MFDIDDKTKIYAEIFRLRFMLEKARIPFTFIRKFDGYSLIIKGDYFKLYAIEHHSSYGNESDLIEILGGLTEEESEQDVVLGDLTAAEVFERFEYCWKNNTSIYNYKGKK